MKKRFTAFLMTMVLALLLVPTGLASASTSGEDKAPNTDYQSPVITIDSNGQSSTITSAPGNDNVEIQATSPFTLDITEPKYGTVRGYWNYNSPGKIVTYVNLYMELQYRKNIFDFTWDTIDSKLFSYSGGLGSKAGDEHTFKISKEGQYRIKITGTVSFLDKGDGGAHAALLYSGQKGYDGGGIIISDEPEAK